MKKVKKAVIPTAGLGTRFLPATKTIPKELLPIVDTPILMFVVEEALRAGADDIILVTGHGKSAIEDFFDISFELEHKLNEAGKSHYLKDLERLRSSANFISIRQREPRGLGHAVLCSQPVIGDEPFMVLLGDEIMLESPHETLLTSQILTQLYQNRELSSIAVMQVEMSEVSKYGIACVDFSSGDQHGKVTSVVEKPSMNSSPSRWALPGRYVFHPEIFNQLRDTKAGKSGEIQLTDAIHGLAQKGRVLASQFSCLRFDAGDKLGFLKANITFALKNQEVAEPLREYILKLVKSWEKND